MGTVLGEEVSPQRRPRDQFLRMVTLVLHEGDTLVLGTCYMLGGMIASRRWFLVSSSLRLSTGDLPLSLSPILQPLGHSFRMFQNFSLSICNGGGVEGTNLKKSNVLSPMRRQCKHYESERVL